MTIRFSCPACGTNLSVPDNMAGRKGKCKKCGADVAAPQPLPSSTPVALAPTPQQLLRTEAGTPEPAKGPPRAGGFPPNLKGAAIAVGLIVIGLLAYHFWPRDNWERDNAPRLAALKAEAETSLVKGDYERSLTKCDEIMTFIGTRTLEDPSLQGILDYARTNKEVSAKKLASVSSPSGRGTATVKKFSAQAVREAISKPFAGAGSRVPGGVWLIQSVSVKRSDDVEFPYMVEVNVSSSFRANFQSRDLLLVATYTFHFDEQYKMSSDYTVKGGDIEAKEVAEHVTKCLDSLRSTLD